MKCLYPLIAAVSLAGIDFQRADAGLIQVGATAEGTALDENRDGTFESIPNFVGIIVGNDNYDSQRIPHSQSRGLLEFSLAGLAAGDKILSATLQFAINENARFSDDPNPVTTATFVGYAGDGLLSLADAVVAGPIVAAPPDNLFIFGVHSAAIDPSFVQGLLGNSGFLGLRAEIGQGILFGMESSLSVQFGDPGPAPTLVIEFESPTTNPVPEPSGLMLFGLGFAALTLFSWKNRASKREMSLR